MSFNTAISGLDASQTDLQTIGNNISNANTVGFKSSNTQFADLYAASLAGAGGANSQPGIGVQVAALSQNFSEGNIQTTNNPLDMAINGGGLFILNDNGQQMYSRNGQFQINAQGYLTNNAGLEVMGYQPVVGVNGKFSTVVAPVYVNKADMPPQATSQASLVFNLNANDPAINTTTTAFSPSNSSSYDQSSTFQVYDSLGTPEQITLYFVNASGTGGSGGTPPPDQWDVYYTATNAQGTQVSSGTLTTLSFNSAGQLTSGTTGTIAVPSGWGNGAAASSIGVSLSGTTLTSSPFSVSSENVDGYGPGQYTSVAIQQDGTINAQFTNGQSRAVGRIALANFADLQGLAPTSGNLWEATSAAGNPLVNPPGTGGLGVIQAGAVEASNVNLSSQLVNMIVAQQAYEANAQTVKTQQQDSQFLMQIV